MRCAIVVEGRQTFFLWHDGEQWYVERIVHDGVTAMSSSASGLGV